MLALGWRGERRWGLRWGVEWDGGLVERAGRGGQNFQAKTADEGVD